MSWYRVLYSSAPVVEGAVQQTSSRHMNQHVVSTAAGQKIVKTRLEPIPKGDSKDAYPESAFKGQPEWARLLIAACEEQFALLRKEQKSLGLMRRRFNDFLKAREQFLESAAGL